MKFSVLENWGKVYLFVKEVENSSLGNWRKSKLFCLPKNGKVNRNSQFVGKQFSHHDGK